MKYGAKLFGLIGTGNWITIESKIKLRIEKRDKPKKGLSQSIITNNP